MRLTVGWLLGLVGCVLAGDGTVLNLDASTFDQTMANNKLVIVSFGAYWCRFSQMLGPIWDQLAQTLTGDAYSGVTAAHVECENHKDLAMKWGISKYPTIKVWKHGELIPKEYRGARTVQHFKSYIDSLLTPALQTLETPEQTQSIGVQRRSVVGLFKDKETNDFKVFAEVAEQLRDFCNFHVAHSTDILGRVVEMPHVLFKQRHAGELTFEHKGENTFAKDELLTWATEHCKPLVDEITFENGEEMTEEGLPFFIMFTHPDDMYSRQRFADAVRKHVVHERPRIKFLVADGHKFEHPLQHMGKQRSDLPVIAIDSFKHMYDFGKIDDLDKPGRMQEFINDLFSGKLHHDFHNTHQELPPPSELQKLGPSKKRYSFNRDEL